MRWRADVRRLLVIPRRWVWALAAALVAVVLAAFAIETAAARPVDAPAQLAALDPGARLGANTIVATATGGVVYAVPRRANFILALGSDETVRAPGIASDQIGALGADVTIRVGRGKDLIYAGPGGTVIGGSGSELVIDDRPDGTVIVDGRGDEVIASGRLDHVLCSASSGHDVIYDNPSDSIAAGCRRHHDRVSPLSRLTRFASAVPASTAAITGTGTNTHPFVAPCVNPQAVDCVVNAFPSRVLKGLWANEYVPAYRCPDDHPYLLNHNYAPFGTYIVPGVEIQESYDPTDPWPIAVSITAPSRSTPNNYGTGTMTEGFNSSATNWSTATTGYRVILHCTSDPDHTFVWR